MITSKQARERYGDPTTESSMVLFRVPEVLQLGAIPKRIYCNRDLVAPLTEALNNIVARGLADQVKTWDGCFQIRRTRTGTSASLHSWGLAIDINAAWNGMGKVPTMSKELVACFTDAGFEWGGAWKKPDGMHMQLAELPT
jgi:hypothetical protein